MVAAGKVIVIGAALVLFTLTEAAATVGNVVEPVTEMGALAAVEACHLTPSQRQDCCPDVNTCPTVNAVDGKSSKPRFHFREALLQDADQFLLLLH
jgi:hypothetical protein